MSDRGRSGWDSWGRSGYDVRDGRENLGPWDRHPHPWSSGDRSHRLLVTRQSCGCSHVPQLLRVQVPQGIPVKSGVLQLSGSGYEELPHETHTRVRLGPTGKILPW